MSHWREMWDEEAREAYDPLDPKHPDFEGLMAEFADMERKRAKEQPLIDEAEAAA